MPLCAFVALALTQTGLASGEAALRALMERSSRLQNVEISISRSARDRKGDAFFPGITALIAYAGPNRFRLEQSEYWGGGTCFTSDGKTLKVAPVDGGPTRLRKAGTSLMTSHPSLAPGGGSFFVLALLMQGPEAMTRLVAPNTKVVATGSRIELITKDLGHMTIYVVDGLASQIWFDNRPNRMAYYRLFPVFGDPPEDPMEIEGISYTFVGRFPSRTFSTAPAPQEAVIDERTKPPIE